MKHLFLIALIAIFFLPQMAQADYTYINNDGEYSITLPDAPVAETIWADQEKVPYITPAPTYGAVGERASLNIVDPQTGDFFSVKMVFIKADKTFLQNLTKEKTQALLNSVFLDVMLDHKKEDYSAGSGTLKWATVSGFSADRNNRLLFNAGHFLVGQDTILSIRIQYTLENKKFNAYYKSAVSSIKYAGK